MITLKDFDHLRNDPRVRFMETELYGHRLTTICYMIADSDFWSLPLALECRGIVFDNETGHCVCRPLEKFFNVGERADTQKHLLDFDNCQIFEKRDGSMVTPVFLDGKLFWKSKKSFSSDVAIKAANTATEGVETLSHLFYSMGYTAIFEYTHPEHQIVIDYGSDPRFTLLAARHNDTGEYLPYTALKTFATFYKENCIQCYTHTLSVDAMFEQMETIKDFEGYVVQLANGIRVKQKSSWYLKMHVIMTALRERDIAKAVIDETLDDIKSMISAEGKDLAPVIEIENRVVLGIENMRIETEQLVKQFESLETRKDIAMTYRDHSMFSLAMKLYDGKEPDYKKTWVDRYLQDFNLRTIYNTSFNQEG